MSDLDLAHQPEHSLPCLFATGPGMSHAQRRGSICRRGHTPSFASHFLFLPIFFFFPFPLPVFSAHFLFLPFPPTDARSGHFVAFLARAGGLGTYWRAHSSNGPAYLTWSRGQSMQTVGVADSVADFGATPGLPRSWMKAQHALQLTILAQVQ